MNTLRILGNPDVPDKIVVEVNGRPITLTRELPKVPSDEVRPVLNAYWVVTVDGTRFAGWPADLDQTEESVRAPLAKWLDRQPCSIRLGPGK